MNRNPKISIVTVVFNGESEIERTIRSVVNQTYKNIEYIIVDGASKDNTLNIVKKYEKKIDKLLSEPDKNLYDAMNKGLALATGEYLWYMNSGDEINDPTTLEAVFLQGTDADVYYGETMLVEESGKELGTRSDLSTHKLPGKLTWKKMNKGMVVQHQSFIVRRGLAPEYDMQYRWAADIDWVIKCLKEAKTVHNTNIILSRFLTNRVLGKFYSGGASTKNLYTSLRERFAIFNKHYGTIPNVFNHLSIGFKALFTAIRPGKSKKS